MDKIFSTLIPTATVSHREAIANVLQQMPRGVIETLAAGGAQIRPLASGERYDKASAALKRLGIDVDAWPVPPAGLFVVEEVTVYLRSRSAMTIAHEVCHALDCCLGGGVYRSGTDAELRKCFTGSKKFVTPYAATGLDEFFAESARAYMSFGKADFNDEASHWPKATRARLLKCDPATHAYFERLFLEIATKHAAGTQVEMVLQ